MDAKILIGISIILICAILVIIIYLLMLLIKITRSNTDFLINRNDPKRDQLFELATAYWRLETEFRKQEKLMPENSGKKINSSLNRINNFLLKNDIKIEDYTGRKYNDGMNLEVIAAEDGGSEKHRIIKETVSPEIMLKGIICKKAQVIVLEKKEK